MHSRGLRRAKLLSKLNFDLTSTGVWYRLAVLWISVWVAFCDTCSWELSRVEYKQQFLCCSHSFVWERCSWEVHWEVTWEILVRDHFGRYLWEILERYLWEILETGFWERCVWRGLEGQLNKTSSVWSLFLRDIWDWLLKDVFEETLRDTWVSAWSFQQTLRERGRESVWEALRDCFGMYLDFAIEVLAIDVFLSICDSFCDSNVLVLVWRVSIRFQFD